ncbi:uncharacterized protein METZ01_LOCUS334735, partial [marine metagenome]
MPSYHFTDVDQLFEQRFEQLEREHAGRITQRFSNVRMGLDKNGIATGSHTGAGE